MIPLYAQHQPGRRLAIRYSLWVVCIMRILSDKVAIVTGASSGIGRATAKLFASEGASVVVVARREKLLNTLVDEIRAAEGRAIAVAGDVTDENTAQLAVRTAEAEFGGLDIAFNNAGILGDMSPVLEMSLASWNKVLASNLTSGFMGAKHQVPAMMKRGSGSIIFTSSFVGYTAGMPNMCHYATSKAGLIGLTKSLAGELGTYGIRVNAVVPGGTDTPMASEFGDAPETVEFVRQMHAFKRIAEPEEIAQAALFLASNSSSFVTGSAMLADGGVSISRT